MTDDAPEERERVYNKIAPLIMEFRERHAGQKFHVEQLRTFVRYHLPEIAPDSPGRILRALRLERQLYYVVLNRRDSLYQFCAPPREYNPYEDDDDADEDGTAPPMSNEPLIVRYRPASFDEVRGNTETIAALRRRIDDPRRPHAYLFTGPSGVGKTTVARIIAGHLKAEVIEVDAASNNGVDTIRSLVEIGHYLAPGAQARLIILDECHMLSRAAWNALLKVLEEPPPHLYLALCTTEPFRVPETVATRCHPVKLDALADQQVADLLVEILIKESWDSTIADGVFQLVVQEALGSPRRALVLLQAVYDAPDVDEAKRIVSLQGSASPLIQIMQIVVRGQGRWEAVRPLLFQLSDADFSEQALIQATRYIIGAMNREENDKRAAKLWELLSAFLYPVHSYDPRSVFYHAIGRIFWGAL